MNDAISQKGFEFVTALGHELSAGNLKLPQFPDITLKVRSAIEAPHASAGKIALVVGSDPILAARVIKVANSAAYHPAERITDLKNAVVRLGRKMVRNTAIAVALEQLLKTQGMGALKVHLRDLWHHAVRVAALSYVLAKRWTRLSPDEALLAGLCHDIGKYYLLTRAELYPELFGDPEMLDRLMSDWHAAVGRAILECWSLPEEVCIAADEHDTLDREHLGPVDLTDVVMVANLHAHLVEDPDLRQRVDWEAVPAFRKLQLTPDASVKIMMESERETASLIQSLSST